MTEYSDTVAKWRSLVQRIAYNTKTGKLNWDDGPYPESVITVIANVVISIRYVGNDYIVVITDEFGGVVDSFKDDDLGELSGGLTAYTVLGQIFRDAKRSISGADKILDQILSELPAEDDGIPF
jgi:hypothetical protein